MIRRAPAGHPVLATLAGCAVLLAAALSAPRLLGHVPIAPLLAGGAGLAALLWLVGLVVARVLGLSLDHLLRFEIGPASVSRLEAGPWGARVLSLNERIGMTA